MDHRIFVAAVCGLLNASCVDPLSDPWDGTDLRIGLAVPYTGVFEASGTNAEQALVMASETLNAAGGVDGRRIAVVPLDTRSNPDTGILVVDELITRFDVSAIIGPQSSLVASALAPIAGTEQVPVVAGSTTVGSPSVDNHRGFFVRTYPANTVMAAALAQAMVEDGVETAMVVHAADPWGTDFGARVQEHFELRGGTVTDLQPVATPDDYGTVAGRVGATMPQAVVVAMYSSNGPDVLSTVVMAQPTTRFYMAPPMRDAFFNSALAQTYAGGVGVLPAAPPEASGAFVDEFSRRWDGDLPRADTFYYYDAFMVLALAIERASFDTRGNISGAAIRDAIPLVASSQDGTSVDWTNVSAGLVQISTAPDEAAAAVNYSGVTGDVDITSDGEVLSPVAIRWTLTPDGNVEFGSEPIVVTSP